MNRFVMVGTGRDYVKRVWQSLLLRDDVTWFDEPFSIDSKIGKTLCHAHTSFLLNRYFNLPLRFLWEKASSINKVKIDKTDTYIFILFDNTLARYTPSYIRNIKSKHKNVFFVLFLDNAMHKKERLVKQHLDQMDLVYTNNKYDADKYGFKYLFNIIPSVSSHKDTQINWDLFFVGNAHDRLEMIHRVHDRMSELGLKSKMYISGVSTRSINKREGIIYNQSLPYNQVTEYYDQSKCLLEVVGEKPTMLTMRMMEALCRNKKLITNHPFILEQSFYDPRYILYFEKPEDITLEFFTQNETVDYHYHNENTPECFLDRVTQDLNLV